MDEMPPPGRNKQRYYVTLTPANVDIAYAMEGTRKLSRLLDRLLFEHLERLGLATSNTRCPVVQSEDNP